MKSTPSSTARRKTFFAFSRSGGQPQIPSPVKRIAPKPSRLTNRSPPNWNVESRACDAAATIFSNPPVRTPAALAEITPKNVRLFIADKICCRDQRSTLNHQLLTDFEKIRLETTCDFRKSSPALSSKQFAN